MGEPLKIGNKHKRYSKVVDKKKFDENLEAVFGKREVSRQAGRTTILYGPKGERIVLRENSKWIAPPGTKDPTIAAKQLAGGISAYDYFIAQQHESGKKRHIEVPKSLMEDHK
jgi:hypothetical protein